MQTETPPIKGSFEGLRLLDADGLVMVLGTLGGAVGPVLTSPETAKVAVAVAKGAVSASAGIAAKKFWSKVSRSAERKALREPIALAFVRAIEDSRLDENADAVLWWTTSGERLLKPFTDREVAESVIAASLASPGDREDAQAAVLAALDRRRLRRSMRLLRWRRRHDGDFGALAAELAVDAEQFLHVLPGTIFDEIQRAACKVDSPLRSLAELASQREIAASLTADQVAALSPWELFDELSQLFEHEHGWHEQMLRQLPYLEGHPDPISLNTAVEVIVGLRRQVGDAESGGDEIYQPASGRAAASRSEPMPLSGAIAQHRRLVVLADPGMGKTWLMHTYAAHIAAESRRELHSAGAVAADMVIPVAVRCDTLASRTPLPLVRAACSLLAERHDLSPALRLWLEERLESGAVVYLLDALDEVPHAELNNLSEMVRAWELTHAKAGAQMVIMSRIAGYQGILDPRQRVELELLPFTVNDVRSYVDSWGLPPGVVETVQERLRSPALAGLARIPLLLALLCQLAQEPGELPTTRAGIYGRILRRFLRAEQRPNAEAVLDGGPFAGGAREREQRLRRLLRPVAFAFADTERGWIDQMASGELIDVLALNPDLLPAGVDVHAVLTHLTVGAGVLIPAGDDRRGEDPPYLWVHRSVAEYLVADQLATLNRTALEAVIQRHVWFDADWSPVWPMLGTLLVDGHRLRWLLEYLLGQHCDPLHQALMTAAHVIAEFDPLTVADLEQLVDQTAVRLLELIDTPARDLAARSLAMVLPYASPIIGAEIVSAVVGHEDARVRRQVVSALMGRSGQPVADALFGLASDNDLDVHMQAAVALASLPGDGVTDKLLAMISDQAETRRNAVLMLHHRPGQDVTDALIALAYDDDDAVRQVAAQALSLRPGQDVTDALITLARDPFAGVRRPAVEGLKARPGPEVTEALVRAIAATDHDDRETQQLAARSLRPRSGATVTDALITLTRQDKSITRSGAAEALRGRPGQVVTDALITLASDDDRFVKQAAARALNGRAGQDVTDALIALTSDNDDQVRFASIAPLRRRPGQDVTDALIALARDGYDPYIPEAAEKFPGLLWRSTVRPVFNSTVGPFFKEPGPNEFKAAVRQAAVEALRDRPGQDVTDALITVAGDDTRKFPVRRKALKVLADRPGQDVTDALIALASDDDNYIQRAAVDALSGRPGQDVTDELIALARHGHLRPAPEGLTAAQTVFIRDTRPDAVRALQRRRGQAVTDALVAFAKDDTGVVRHAAAEALAGRPGQDVTGALIALASDDDNYIKRAAADALRGRPGKDITTTLVALAGDDNEHVRLAAIVALEGRSGEDVTTRLIAEAFDPQGLARESAARIVAQRVDPQIAQTFARASNNPPWASTTDRIAELWYDMATAVANNAHAWPTDERQELFDALGKYTAAAFNIGPEVT